MASFISSPTNCKRQEADIIRKTRFFYAIDEKFVGIIIKDVYKEEEVSYSTSKYWLQQEHFNLNVLSRTMQALFN